MEFIFTDFEMAAFLKRKGYECKTETIKMWYSVYHNAVESDDVEVWAVYKDGKPILKPSSTNFRKSDWLKYVFEMEFRRALLDL